MYYCSVEQDLNGTFVDCVLCCRDESEEAVRLGLSVTKLQSVIFT